MISLTKFKGFEYKKFTNYQEITDYILNTKCDVHELGLSSSGDIIYGLSVGDLSKPMIFVDGTMHGGHEWRCTHWAKEWIERINIPVGDPNKPLIEKLKSKFCFFVIPCLNTYGYLNDSYNNANGVNLNRNFPVGWDDYQLTEPFSSQYKGTAPFSEPESQIIKSIYDNYRVVGHVNCHIWGGYNGGVFETASTTKPVRSLLNDIKKSIQLSVPECEMVIRYQNLPSTPWVNEWGGTQSSKSGKNVVSVIFEVGSEETDYMKAELGMTGLFIFAYQISKWYTKSTVVC